MSHRSRIVIGMDLGDKKSEAFVLDKKTGSCDRFEVRTTRKGMSEVFSTYESSRVAIEVGTHSRWFADVLEPQLCEKIGPRGSQRLATGDPACC